MEGRGKEGSREPDKQRKKRKRTAERERGIEGNAGRRVGTDV